MAKESKAEQGAISVRRSIWVNAPVERTWAAVTDQEMLTKWYSPGSIWKIPELKEGAVAEFHLMTNEEDPSAEKTVIKASIEEAERYNKLTFRWHENPSFPGMLLVTHFLLEEENGGTKVTIYETGYETISEDEREAWLQGVGDGYAAALENLKALIEKGDIIHK